MSVVVRESVNIASKEEIFAINVVRKQGIIEISARSKSLEEYFSNLSGGKKVMLSSRTPANFQGLAGYDIPPGHLAAIQSITLPSGEYFSIGWDGFHELDQAYNSSRCPLSSDRINCSILRAVGIKDGISFKVTSPLTLAQAKFLSLALSTAAQTLYKEFIAQYSFNLTLTKEEPILL